MPSLQAASADRGAPSFYLAPDGPVVKNAAPQVSADYDTMLLVGTVTNRFTKKVRWNDRHEQADRQFGSLSLSESPGRSSRRMRAFCIAVLLAGLTTAARISSAQTSGTAPTLVSSGWCRLADLPPAFPGASDGSSPYATLVEDSNGLLFGTTATGGGYGNGLVYSITNTGSTINYLYSFSY